MSPHPSQDPAPTRVRYQVLALVCGLSMVTYLDRVCFGAAAGQMASELGLADVADLKWAFTAFAIAYAVFEVPAGWMGDRFGPRMTLLRIVSWWSVCTALTGLVGVRWGGQVLGGLGALIALRFLFGAGEAGAYPNITRALHNWFPADSWDQAQGLVWMSGRLMGGLTPLVWALLVYQPRAGTGWVSWRAAFALFGCLGGLWCAVFALVFRNRPGEHPRVNAGERALIGGAPGGNSGPGAVPYRRFLANRSLWALCGMYFLINYGWVFNITYLPNYLDQRFGLPPGDLWAAVYKGAPLWVGAVGCLTGGLLVPLLGHRLGSRRRGRQLLGVVAMSLCALCWWGAQRAGSVHQFCVLVSLAALVIDLTLGATWATCHELGGRFAAVTAAIMNTIGTLGSAVAAWLTGSLVEWTVASRAASARASAAELSETARHAALLDGYQTVFFTYMLVYVLAALCWLAIDPGRTPLEETGGEASQA